MAAVPALAEGFSDSACFLNRPRMAGPSYGKLFVVGDPFASGGALNGSGRPMRCDTGRDFDSSWLLTKISPPKRRAPITRKYAKIGIRINFSNAKFSQM
jgi:hypothetical protein